MSCPRCGTPLTVDGGIEGYCPRCLAAIAFGAAGGGEVVESEDGVSGGALPVRMAGFDVLEEIGRGGSGTVFRARQARLGREVALKVLHVGPWSRPDVRERFRREAMTAAALRHPNIVTVYEAGEVDGHAYLAMELVAGRSLAEMTRGGPLSPERAASYARGVAEGVAAAHARGILHRDLKPANVLIDERDQPRVADFGLAKSLDPGADGAGQDASEFTGAGQVLGSPGYMPPEQADPARGSPTFASDVYALGALLYHLLTGRPPFAGPTVAATLAQVLRDEPAPPRRLNSGVPRDLETICLRCLQKEPARRYATLAAVADDLSAFLQRRPIQARPISSWERAVLWCRRRPELAMLVGALLGVASVGLGGVLAQAAENRRNLYAADLRLASLAVEEGDYGRARTLLMAHRSGPGDARSDFLWRHLHRVSQGDERRVLGEHPWIVNCVAWSPDGRRLASGSVGSGTVGADTRIWDLQSDPPAMRILEDRGARHLAWFPDGRRLMVAHPDGEVGVYDTSNRVRLATFRGTSAALSRDGRLLLTCEGNRLSWEPDGAAGPVRLHDLERGTTREFGMGRWATLAPDGTRIAVADLRTEVRVLDVASGRTLNRLESSVTAWSYAFSPDGRWLAAARFDGPVPLWEVARAGSPARMLEGHAEGTWQAAFSSEGRHLATASSDQSIRLWDPRTGTLERVLRGHRSEVWCVAFSPDGTFLASGGKDRSVVIWPVAMKSAPEDVPGRWYAPLIFAANSRWLATADPSNAVDTLVQDRTGDIPPVRVAGIQPLALSAEPARLLGLGPGFVLREVDWRQGRIVRELTLEHASGDPAPDRVVTTPNGAWAAGINRGGGVAVWSGSTGSRRAFWNLAGAVPWFVHLRDDGQWCAVTAGESGFWVGRVDWPAPRRLTAHRDMAKWAAFSPDGRWLATASVDAAIGLWRLPDLRLVRMLRGHPNEVSCVAFSAGDGLLVSSEQGHGLRFWDPESGREVGVLRLPEVEPGLEFSRDGLVLGVSTGADRWRLLEAPR